EDEIIGVGAAAGEVVAEVDGADVDAEEGGDAIGELLQDVVERGVAGGTLAELEHAVEGGGAAGVDGGDEARATGLAARACSGVGGGDGRGEGTAWHELI